MSDWQEELVRGTREEPLRLVIPAALGEGSAVAKLVSAIREALEDMDQQARRCAQAIAESEADSSRARWWTGCAEGVRIAAESLETCLTEELDAWDQVEVREEPPVVMVASTAKAMGWLRERPDFPVPDDADPTLELRAVMALRHQIEAFARNALLANARAFQGLAPDMVENPDVTELERARAWAIAADRLEATLAELYGRRGVEEHIRFTDEHGPWLAKVVFP